MTARAYVLDDIPMDGIAIYLIDRAGEHRYLLKDGDRIHLEPNTQAEPSLRISAEFGRALLDALAAHFGGVSEAQTLRADYLAERARVDKLIDNLIQPPAVIVRE